MRRREWAILLLAALALPLLVAGMWRTVYADAAYATFRAVQVKASILSSPAPLYGLLLALAARLGLDLPAFALVVAALGWATGGAAWALTGRAVGRPAFATATVLLLALHPLQGRVLGLETGLVVGLVGLLAYAAVTGRRALTPVTLAVMAGAHPPALPFAALLLPLRRGGEAHSLRALAAGGAAATAGYALLAGLDGTWRDGELALLVVGLQIVTAAGFTFLLSRMAAGPLSAGGRRALGRSGLLLALAALALLQAVFLVRDWQLRPAGRLALYNQAAAWLRRNALDGETVAATHPEWIGYLAGRPAVGLPPAAPAQELLALLERERPDYCITPRGVVWQELRVQPWFQAHYTAVGRHASPYDAASPLTVYRYAPTPFDAGETIPSPVTFTLDDGARVALEGYRLSARRIYPGEPLYLTLFWQPQEPVRRALHAHVRLLDPQSGRVWIESEHPAPGGLRTDCWNGGMRLTDRYTLQTPPTLPLGDYALEVALLTPHGRPVPASVDGREVGTSHVFARVSHPLTVSSTPLQADHPLSLTLGSRIALAGYDVEERVAPGSTLRVTLYWQALEPIPLDYKVFIHLETPDGQVVAQDDAMPVGWTYPTTEWRPGDTIRDTHHIELEPSLPRGDYRLLAGLYDPATGDRLIAYDAQGNAVGDRVFLQQVPVR